MVAESSVARDNESLAGQLADGDAAMNDGRPTGRFGWWRRLLRPVTSLGWGVLGGAVIALVAGAVSGWSEWLGIGVALVAVFLAAVLMSLGRFAFLLQLRVSDRRLLVGEPGRAGVRVRNESRRRLLPAAMELVVSGTTYAVTIPSLPGNGGMHDVILPVPTDKRAVLTVGPVRAIRGDVLGLIRRVVNWPLGERVFVHPRTVQSTGSLAGFVRDLEGDESNIRTPSDLSFHSLRDYVPGDDRRHIHWKKTARTGTLLVREFLETRRSMVVVVLSTDPADYFDDEEFELAVSCAASMMGDLIRANRQVVTTVSGGDIRGINVPSVLDQFSAVLPDEERGGLAPTARAAVRRHPNVSLMIAVFGSKVTPAQVRAAYQSRPPGTQVLGIRARQPDSTEPTAWAAGQTVTVPDLQALPKAVRGVRA